MKVAIYARSSSKNHEESIRKQLAAIQEYCQKEGHTIAATYIDRAGSNMDNRSEFFRMIDDAKKGAFDAVFVHKLDRLARSKADIAKYEHELEKAGARLLTAEG